MFEELAPAILRSMTSGSMNEIRTSFLAFAALCDHFRADDVEAVLAKAVWTIEDWGLGEDEVEAARLAIDGAVVAIAAIHHLGVRLPEDCVGPWARQLPLGSDIEEANLVYVMLLQLAENAEFLGENLSTVLEVAAQLGRCERVDDEIKGQFRELVARILEDRAAAEDVAQAVLALAPEQRWGMRKFVTLE
jgi:hypothetical protein